jgi:arginase
MVYLAGMDISLIAIPYSNDVSRWGGANGPQAFLDAGLITSLNAHGHASQHITWINLPREKRTRDSVVNLGYLAARASDAVFDALQRGLFPLVLEGNCTHCVGPAGGVARALGSAGIAWYDAHGDMHTMQTTSTGLLGGMPFGVCMGWEFDDWRERAGLHAPVNERACALFGASDLDPEEVDALNAHPIARLDAADMMHGAGDKTSALLKPRATEANGWYLHFDMDVAGTDEVPGGLTPAPHWPPRAELIASVAATAGSVPMRCFGLAAYDPGGDPQHKGAQLGIEIVCAALDAVE